MTSKHTLISAATLANLLVIVVPGLMLFWEVIGDIGYATGLLEPLRWFVQGLIALGVVGMGLCNILAVQLTYFRPGPKQSFVHKAGYVSCGLMVVSIVLVTVVTGRPVWLILPGIVVTLTILALKRVQPERAPDWACPTCEYDLRGIESSVCPECGGDAREGKAT